MTVRLLLERAAPRVVPPRLRPALRRLATRGDTVRVDGWDAPLVAGGPAPAWPAPAPAPRRPSLTVEGPGADAPRCLLVADTLDAGGVDEFVAFLARSLPGQGVRTAVLLASADRQRGIGPIGQDLIAEGITVVDLDADDGGRWIRQWRPDIVSLHGDLRWPLDVANDLGVPAALVLHGTHDLLDADSGALAEQAGRLSAVVSVSDLVLREYLVRLDGEPPRITRTIPNGVDPRKVSRIPREVSRRALGLGDETLFLSLSRHSLQKNTYGLVSAFEDVAAALPTAHLVVCGRVDDHPYTRQALALRERSPHRDRIHLRDNTRRTDVLLGAADVFVLDSFFEGWALASMEALASGVPAVLSDVGGAREQLGGSVPKGALVTNPLGRATGQTWEAMARARYRPQPNRDELVAAMVSVATDDALAATRDSIAEESLARLGAETCVEEHARLLRDVLATTVPGGAHEPR